MLLKSSETQTDKVDQAHKKLKVILGIFTTKVAHSKTDLNSSYLLSDGTSHRYRKLVSLASRFFSSLDFTYVVNLFSGEVKKVTLFALTYRHPLACSCVHANVATDVVDEENKMQETFTLLTGSMINRKMFT